MAAGGMTDMSNGSGSGIVGLCSEQKISEPTTLLLLPLLLSLFWVLLDLFYSSAILGWLVSRLASLVLADSGIHLGSVQLSPLTGRMLFKDVHYYCRDFSIRVADGYVALQWWKRAGVGGCLSCRLGSVERRNALVLFQLNGFQLHWYNRSDVYDNWGRYSSTEGTGVADTAASNSLAWSLWKDLQPSLHFTINKGRLVFGNQLIERSLAVYCQTAEAYYHTTEASNAYDELLHVVRLWGTEVRAVLECSAVDAIDSVDQVLRSDSATVTYSWDSPGLVPLGDTPDPQFSWEVELGANSVINYGSYANRHRHFLQRFFFPNDYLVRPPSDIPQPGEKRIFTHMDISVRLSSKGYFNIPFRDDKDKLHQIGFSLGEGSEVKVHQPWITTDDGYTSRVTGNLEAVVVTSDMSYPHLASAASLQLDVALQFPRVWNATQKWDMKLNAFNVEISVLFSYIDFVNALLDDWLGSDDADLLNFVPLDWTITTALSDYEIYLFTSRYNWLDMDCLENARLAFCGTTGQIKLHFPFTVFNPAKQEVTFSAEGQDVVVRHFVPPSDSAKEAVLALAAANKHRWRVMAESNNRSSADREAFPMGYRGHTYLEDGWVDLACGTSISLAIMYTSRNHDTDLNLPHSLHVDVRAPCVLLRVFGFLATDLLGLKENYPGIYLEFSTYNSTFPLDPLTTQPSQPPLTTVPPASPPSGLPDKPNQRFVDIIVDFSLHNITAEFPTFPNKGLPMDAALPSLCADKLAVLLYYTASDTKVFLHVTPFTILIPSWPSSNVAEVGHVVCGGLQLNCHGLTEMLLGERVEYAWLMQFQINKITAALSTTQLMEAGAWLQTVVQQVVGVADTRVEAPNGVPIQPLVEPLSEDIKYFLFGLTLAELDVTLTEGEQLLKLQSPGLDIGMCKLHAEGETLGLSLQLEGLTCSLATSIAGELRRLAEAGRLVVGPVQAELSVQEPQDCVPQRQWDFLRRADMSSRRLCFLWTEQSQPDCGCCGGCQFLDGLISRQTLQPQVTTTIGLDSHQRPAHTAALLVSLKKSLHTMCLRDLACPHLLHTGLLEYYEGASKSSPNQCSPPGSDTESFASAKDSLSSEYNSDTNEFFSLENVNEAGLEGHTFPTDNWRNEREQGREAAVLDSLYALLPSYKYNSHTLHISRETHTTLQERRDRLNTQFFAAEEGATHARRPSDVSSPPTNETKDSTVLRLPVLSQDQPGQLPTVCSTPTAPSGDRPDSISQASEHQSKINVKVKALGNVSAIISPPTSKVIASMLESATHYFSQRAAEAVLTGCSLETFLSLKSYLTRLLESSAQPEPFSAQISLAIEPEFSLNLQLVQSHQRQHHLSSGVEGAVCSLITAAVSGLQVSSLLQTCTQRTAGDEENRSTISSVQLSLQGKCSSLQVSLAAQLCCSGEKLSTPLPNLPLNSHGQPPLISPRADICRLLEAGCFSLSFTVAAKFVTMEVSPKAVLTWEHIQSLDIDTRGRAPSLQQTEEISNQLAVSVSLPQVWTDIAAPSSGRPSSKTGGLDPLLVYEVGVAWQRHLQAVVSAVKKMVTVKQDRDQRTFLSLLTNAAHGTLKEKVGCCLVTPVALAVRQCVVFHCLYEVWSCLPAFLEAQVKSIPILHSYKDELLATAIFLATRIFSEGEFSTERRRLRSTPVPIDPATCPSCGPYRAHHPAASTDSSSQTSGGYIKGISPSPSELALPNVAFSTQQLDQLDVLTSESVSFAKMVVIRESLLPLLRAIGVSTAPQLRALCHNKRLLEVDCSIQLREGTVCVSESMSTPSLPALQLEQISIQGHLLASHNVPTSFQSPSFLLLFRSTAEGGSETNSSVRGNFSAQAGIVSVGITESLMKLSRHLIETSKTLSHRVPPRAKPTSMRDGEVPAAQSTGLWNFSQRLVEEMATLQRAEMEVPRVSYSRPPSAGSIHSRSVRAVIADLSHSPRNINIGSQTGEPLSPREPPSSLHCDVSMDSSSSEAPNAADHVTTTPTSPASQSPLDTSGADLPSSDDMHLSSESHHRPPSPPPESPGPPQASECADWVPDVAPLQQALQTPPTQLSHSIFGLVRVDSMSVSLHVETSTSSLRLAGITGSVDSRKLSAATGRYHFWPSYLSLVATIKTTQLGVSDRPLDIVRLVCQPIHFSVGFSNSSVLPMPSYRCLLKMLGCQVVVKQPPVLVHKRVQQLLPAFTQIYHDVLSPLSEKMVSATPEPSLQPNNLVQMPSQLPQGYTHFSLTRVELVMTPLPSLSITYTINPLTAHIETTQKISYQLSIGTHTLRFNPREQQVTLRSLVLPTVRLSGDVRRALGSHLPLVSVSLTVQKVNIDLTTDSLNQLLVLQNSFIKEVNELVQLFISIGESLPQQMAGRSSGLQRRESDAGDMDLLSLLDSCRVSIDEISVTVSTPLCTALRFQTSRIDMLITNSGSQAALAADVPIAKSQLLLLGRVDIHVNLALGYLQDSSSEDDDFCELAYFKTKISIRNTQQNAPHLSLGGEASENDDAVPLDTFFISIMCPHLYIQSSAVEQAILFWLNCKSVYSYWQNQRKLLNEEVQIATEKFVAQIQSRRPTTLQGSSLDFSKPRLVQISMTDVGACMPMTSVLYTPQTSQSFPALVLTVKEMLLVVNLSKKVASSGSLSGFCLRFANQFTLRQRTWTTDLKKNKMINCGVVNQGTFRLCVATKKRRSDTDSSVVLGEKLVWAFQWDMSGIDVNANSDIGHHLSTLVRTATTIGTSLEGQQPTHLAHTATPATPPAKTTRKLHKRALSEAGPVKHEAKRVHMEEGMTNLAKGTINVSHLQSLGASRESIKREMEALKETEQQLRKNVGKLFRRRRGFSFQRIAEFFKPTSAERMGRGRGIGMQRRWTLKAPRRLFSTSGSRSTIPEEGSGVPESPMRQRSNTLPGGRHLRTVSDVTQQFAAAIEEESSSPNLTPSVTPIPGEEVPGSPFPPTPFSSTPTHQTFSFIPQEPAEPQSSGPVTSIDVEVNITVNIDSGIVKLRCKEESVPVQRTSSPSLLTQAHYHLMHTHSASSFASPLQPRKLQGGSANDTVIILIPALSVQVHYKSLVGQSYQFPSPSTSLTQPTTHFLEQQLPNIEVSPSTPDSVALPMKRGILAVSVVVKSTPEDMTLNPSLLEFVEQVVRPTIAATESGKADSSSDGESEEEGKVVEEEETPEKTDTPPISFPVDVTIVFHMQPSKVCFSCQPHSRVHCVVCSPNVNFVVSFSLFSAREVEGAALSPTQHSIVTFNNLYVTGCLETFTLQVLSPQVSSLKYNESESKTTDKEALSLTLGQALVHLSRKSVLVPSRKSSPDAFCSQSKLQVSAVASIASLVLGYDMRRLNDLTAFRRYWYRTSLVESFIGSKKQQQLDHETTEGTIDVDGHSGIEEAVDSSTSAAIVVAAAVEDFRISANVAQVMGNTDLVVTHLQCQVHADISHNELVLLRLTGRMEKGEVDARGGVVAGTILMQDVQAQVTTESHFGLIPMHSARVSVAEAQTRVDYMSSCILLGRASQLLVTGRDLWEGLQLAGQQEQTEEANIQVLVELSWEQVQLAIHRTTTKSLMNIVQKIQDFLLQQKRRSERTISIMLPPDTRVSKALAAYREKEKQAEQKKDEENVTGRPENHWLWATRCGSVELMRTLGVSSQPGQHQVSLGGKISVSGQNFCLVCFHGTSFRDNEWAVFNIDQVSASFLTLAIPGLETEARGRTRTCQQICELQLGGKGSQLAELATVHRVTAGKGRVPAITGTNINNWLAYVCIDSHLHQQDNSDSQTQQTLLKFSKKLSIQQILLVPGLSVKLINDHFWPVLSSGLPHQQLLLQNPPLVECSLISHFSTAISVSTNVEHYLFLHDLVVNYIEYLERHKVPLRYAEASETPNQQEKKEKEEVDEGEQTKRQFQCVCWKLEPRLTLLSSVSGEFNPHISWLLERLGFKHAQTTIPKWVQRGAMDPLDKTVALALEQLVQFSGKKKLKFITNLPQ